MEVQFQVNVHDRVSPPEVLEYGLSTSKADVYSFGVVMWELFSFGRLPYAECTNDTAMQMVLQIIDIHAADIVGTSTRIATKLPARNFSIDAVVSTSSIC